MLTVSLQAVLSRQLAAVRARLPLSQVPRSFARFLTPVYDAARSTGLELDGLNVFVYEGDDPGAVDVTFGVGVSGFFAPIGEVQHVVVPGGEVASVTRWGDYSGLGPAHAAILAWCRDSGRTMAGPRWEIYGHYSDDPAARRTDVQYLLRG